MDYLATIFDSNKLDFRAQATLCFSVAAVLLVTPFSIFNLFHARYILGGGALVLVLLMATNLWTVRRGKYWSELNFYALVPVTVSLLSALTYERNIIGVLWSYPVILGYYCMLPEQRAQAANALLLLAMIPMSWICFETQLVFRIGATLIAVSVLSGIFVYIITQQQHRLEALIVTDPLTGLFNRTLLDKSLEQASQQSFRTKTPMTLLAMDLDHFKVVNDSLGHDAGDRVLQGIGQLLRDRLRRTDTIFRIGGEEFLVLLFNANEQQSKHVAESLRHAVSTQPLLPDHPVTVSIGVATLKPDEDFTDWTKRADLNLYQAKADGRNRVVI